MKKDKQGKIKELMNKYKEAKKDPRKKAGMKLLGYFIFFIILALLANIAGIIENSNSNNKIKITTTTTKAVDKYVEKQNKLITDKFNINYEIKYNDTIYKINGTLENNIINGYLEDVDNIKKIVIKNNVIYEIKNEIENELEVIFNINYINVEYILNVIKQSSAFIEDEESTKTYLYEIKNDITTNIYVKTNEEYIEEIIINEDNNEYKLIFDN